ncbi:MAG TPA: hypothetical protein VFE45_16955, partial [Coriobacteriia bacterium]|nr:hypothetical protein [Coriobacteriia bacterium]
MPPRLVHRTRCEDEALADGYVWCYGDEHAAPESEAIPIELWYESLDVQREHIAACRAWSATLLDRGLPEPADSGGWFKLRSRYDEEHPDARLPSSVDRMRVLGEGVHPPLAVRFKPVAWEPFVPGDGTVQTPAIPSDVLVIPGTRWLVITSWPGDDEGIWVCREHAPEDVLREATKGRRRSHGVDRVDQAVRLVLPSGGEDQGLAA